MDINQHVDFDQVIPPSAKEITDEPPAYYSSPSSSPTLKTLERVSRQDHVEDCCGQSSRSTASPPPEFPALSNTTTPDTIPTPPHQYSDKLYTNYIPSTPEITEIKQYVYKVNQKLSSYDDRMAELEAALQELSTKRSQLSEIAIAHEALISPVRRLPPEILQMIFVFCLPNARNAVMHASEPPVLLGRVCSEWRRISLATPEAWASLHIVPPNVNFANPTSSMTRFQRKKEIIEMWLTRSGACPLNISFVWFAGDSEEEIKLCGMLLETLVPMCGRWRVLDFQVPLKMFKPFVGLTVDDVPLLEGLSLMDNRTPLDSDAVDRWPESLNFAESASKLRTFTLTFFSGGIRLPSIPWSQLTILYLESNIAFFFCDSREMISTFANCECLQSCTLKFPLSHTATLPAFEKLDMPVTLPQLAVLCLDGDQHLYNTFHMSNTLMNLVAPKLRKLEILGRSGRPDGNIAPEPLSAIRALLERSKCALERLHIESITIVPAVFIECLRLAPNLDDLVVHNWAVRLQIGVPPIVVGPTAEDGGDENAAGVNVDGGDGALTGLMSVATAASMAQRAEEVAEDLILKALTIKKVGSQKAFKRKQLSPFVEPPTGPSNATSTQPTSSPPDESSSSATPVTSQQSLLNCMLPPHLAAYVDDTPICPRLRSFDFTLCDASQKLLCDFVASRWEGIPEDGLSIDLDSDNIPGEDSGHDPSSTPSPRATPDNQKVLVTRIKTVKCNFTAVEEEGVKIKMQKFRAEGLDSLITYQAPITEDINPSPWTGLDAPS